MQALHVYVSGSCVGKVNTTYIGFVNILQSRMAPPFSYDIEAIARLYRESGIQKVKRNDLKKEKWKKIALNYSEDHVIRKGPMTTERRAG